MKNQIMREIAKLEKLDQSQPICNIDTSLIDDLAEALGYMRGRELGNLLGWNLTLGEVVAFAKTQAANIVQ